MTSQEVPVAQGPDRRRMLNVLAQRRYRQRKREHVLSLEKKLKLKRNDAVLNVTERETQPLPPLFAALPGLTTYDNNLLDDPNPSSYMIGAPASICLPTFLPNSAVCSLSDDWSMSIEWGANNADNSFLQFETSNQTSHGKSSQVNFTTTDSQLSADIQDLETAQFTFPAERSINIPAFKTLEVSLQIAQMLGLGDGLMDLTINRVLDVTKFAVSWEDLPVNLRPTKAQLSLPHHPVLDILPWPAVRTRLICLFSQPDQLRPPIARGPLAVMQFLHDLDDEVDGLRISEEGDRPCYDGTTWEIGQTILKHWWWALDPEIISNSNKLRKKRGVPKLQLSLPFENT